MQGNDNLTLRGYAFFKFSCQIILENIFMARKMQGINNRLRNFRKFTDYSVSKNSVILVSCGKIFPD